MRKGRDRRRPQLYLCGVCVQGVPSQALRPKDTLELSLQLPKKVLPLGAQQEPGAARVPQAQHVVADAAQQTLQKLLRCLAWGQGSTELQNVRGERAALRVRALGRSLELPGGEGTKGAESAKVTHSKAGHI